MNNYPEWWDRTVTIYNRFQDPETKVIKWYRTVVYGCFWKYIGEEISVGSTTLTTNNTVCRIRQSDSFIEKYKWLQLPNSEMPKYFTVGVGDILVLGDVLDEIDEYSKGSRSSDFLQKYKNLQGAMVVENVAINVGGGRSNEHYHIVGV